MDCSSRLCLLVSALFCFCEAPLVAEDWPQFLGANRNGISAETGLIRDWPSDGPPVAWNATIGEGMSGCVVVDGKLITTAQDDESQYAICLDAADGHERWRTEFSTRYENGQGHGPRATPTVVDGAVYVYGGDGVLAKLTCEDGKIVWKVDVVRQFGGKVADYGLSCSPLVSAGHVVVTMDTDGKQSYGPTVCVDATDGKLKWKSAASSDTQREQPGYSSPVLMNIGGKDLVVMVNGSRWKGIDLKSGKTAWSEEFETDYACNTASPLIVDANKVFMSAGENHGCALYQVDQSGPAGKVTVKEHWASWGPKSVMRNEWQTSILVGDYLYGFDNQGSAGSITNLCCVNWRTGKQQWIERRFGKGNMIAADGMMWMSNMDGELILAKIDSAAYAELGRTRVIDSTRQAPALANGFLYIRGKDSVVCVDVRAEQSE